VGGLVVKDAEEAVGQTRAWLRDFVVGRDMCPYASGPLRSGRVRIAVSEGADAEAALADLMREADRLNREPASRVETTLLVLTKGFPRFDAFWEASLFAQVMLKACDLEGILQVVAFHPDFRFEGAAASDPGNAVNRSPFPMWHLLREASVAQVLASDPEAAGIPERNRARLESGEDLS
jgi:hypothetical protein